MAFIGDIFKELFQQNVKIFITLLILAYLQYLTKKKALPALKYFKLIIYVLLARDIAFAVIQVSINIFKITIIDKGLFIILIADISILFIYLLWLREYTGKRNHDLPICIINIVSVIFIILNIFLFRMAREWLGLIYLAIFIANIIYLGVNLFAVSIYNTDNAELIIESRSSMIVIPLIFCFPIYLIIPIFKDWLIIHSIALAVAQLLHIYILFNYNNRFDLEQAQELKFVTNDLESVFEYMRVLGKAISEKLSLDEILSYIINSTVKTTSADAGAILMVDEYEDILKVKAVSGFFPPLYPVPDVIIKQKISTLETYFRSTPIPLGETIFGEVAKSGKPKLIKNTISEPLLVHNTKNDTLFVNSIILIPLVIGNRVLGILSVIYRGREKVFSENDFEHLKTFGEYATLTIDFILTYMELLEKREMEREIGIAAEIQQKLLPKKLPKMPSLDLFTYSVPAKGVSGDYYDVIQLKGNKLVIVICDVAGKGVPAALVMVMIRSILHLITTPEREIATILTWVNRGICGQIDIDHYATMSLVLYDQTTREITYSNAAHHPLLIFHHDTKKLETLDTEGLPIGIDKTTRYGQKRSKLASGDIIAMYTDGIIEAMNLKGEQYTSERFHQLIADHADQNPKDLTETIKDELAAFVGNAKQHDDQTLILMKIE